MPMNCSFVRAQRLGTAAWILSLICSLPTNSFHSSSTANASAKTETTPSEPQCRNLNLSFKSATSDDPLKRAVISQMKKFEKAFANGDSSLFVKLASRALKKEKRVLEKIFEGTIAEYGLQKTQLQRNSVWEIEIPNTPTPSQLVRCGDIQISPVYGPNRQVAVFYSSFARDKHTKILLYLAQTPLDDHQPEHLGMVLMQVQKWTYDGKSPEKIYQQSVAQEGRGHQLVARILADAAAKILESNPYVVTTTKTEARQKAELLKLSSTSQLQSFLNSGPKLDSLRPEALEPIFRNGTLAVGLKVRMSRELSLNTQVNHCKALGTVLFPKNSPWRNEFSGFECLLYASQEVMTKPPKAGSKYLDWESLDSK